MADPYTESNSKGGVTIKPVIKELVRTQFCFPDIVLLVDKIIIAKFPSAKGPQNLEAYRLYLTDREKSIQGSQPRKLSMNY